jgi:CRISPR/Cas system-associated exonuclease Cas4 (RecB family)
VIKLNFEERIKNQLLKEQDARKLRERSGMWTPSRFGRCFRLQFYSRRNEPETEPINVEKLRRFAVGNLVHKYAQRFYPEADCEIKITKDDVVGYADIVHDNKVTDIKSVSDWEYKKIISPDYDIEKEKETHCLQVCTYAWALDLKLAGLIFINIMNIHSVEYDIRVDHFIPKIEDELSTLRTYWISETLPPAIPRAYNGKDCEYCPYMTTCLKTEGKIA